MWDSKYTSSAAVFPSELGDSHWGSEMARGRDATTVVMVGTVVRSSSVASTISIQDKPQEMCFWLPLLLFLPQRSSQEDQEDLLFLPRSCSLVESRWRPGLGCPSDQHCPGRSAPAMSQHICAASLVCYQPWRQHLCLKGSHSLPCLLLLCLSFQAKGGTMVRGVRKRQRVFSWHC